MSDPFVAEVRIFPFNFAPKGWAFCDGQLLPISQNTALFSLLGTTYGGDGKTTFALPDFQGRVPMHPGQGPGLSLHDLGEEGGSDFVTLLQSEMPAHSHTVQGSNTNSNQQTPTLNFHAGSIQNKRYAPAATVPDVTMNAMIITPTGGSLPHNNLSPYLTLNFCIALQGVFPPRT
jgi:microcystin-dependent protein